MNKHKYIESIMNIKNALKLLWNASRGNFALLLVCNILSGVIVPCSLFTMKEFIDALVNFQFNNINIVVFWLCLHGILQIITDILDLGCSYLRDMQTDYVNKYITIRILYKVDKMEMEQFDDPVTYNKLAKINDEALSRSISINENAIMLVKNLVVLFGVTGILFSYNKILFFVALIVYLPIFFVNTKIYERMYNLYNSRVEKLRLVEALKEVYTKYEGIKEIRLYNIESFLKDKIITIHNKYIKENENIRRKNLYQASLAKSIHYVATYIMKVFVIVDTLREGKTVGDITMYINSIDILQDRAGSILNILSSLYNDNLYIQTLFEFLRKEELNISEQQDSIEQIETIEFKNVCFKYPGSDKMVLNNINMSIKKGKSYLLAGFNGSGKTTLIKLLVGMYKPTSGEILVNGENIQKYDKYQYHKLMSAVFQDFLKLPLDVNENIKIGNVDLRNQTEKIKQASKKAGANDFICKLPKGYHTILQRGWQGGIDLSGGQWQKIALSRAYYSDAPFIIMDEPAASLDAEAEDILYRKILEMMNGKTCIMISHRLTTAQIVDYIFVMENGTLVENGEFTHLLGKKGVFYKLYSLQAQKYSLKEGRKNDENGNAE